MKNKLFLVVMISGVLFFVAPPAQAMLIKVDFTATNFKNINDPTSTAFPPFAETVSGVIVYNAASLTGNIESLSSINLTINSTYGTLGHTYGISEIGFYPSPPYTGEAMVIGGVGNYQYDETNGVSPSNDDFMLSWNKSTALWPRFIYTTSANPIMWLASDFNKWTVAEVPAPVPEPSTMLLLGSGLAGLVGYGRRRFKK